MKYRSINGTSILYDYLQYLQLQRVDLSTECIISASTHVTWAIPPHPPLLRYLLLCSLFSHNSLSFSSCTCCIFLAFCNFELFQNGLPNSIRCCGAHFDQLGVLGVSRNWIHVWCSKGDNQAQWETGHHQGCAFGC